MDNVKQMYVERISDETSVSVSPAASDITSRCDIPSMLFKSHFQLGWALPQRKKSRFSIKQRKFVYGLFIEGKSLEQR